MLSINETQILFEEREVYREIKISEDELLEDIESDVEHLLDLRKYYLVEEKKDNLLLVGNGLGTLSRKIEEKYRNSSYLGNEKYNFTKLNKIDKINENKFDLILAWYTSGWKYHPEKDFRWMLEHLKTDGLLIFNVKEKYLDYVYDVAIELNSATLNLHDWSDHYNHLEKNKNKPIYVAVLKKYK